MHHQPDQVHWHEPRAGENAGFGRFKRPPMPYDRFMEAEGVPVFRGIGVQRVQDLPMAPWKRLGGRGSYIQLYGTEGLWGMYVVEVPGAGALKPEKHLFEKIALVIEGRGSTDKAGVEGVILALATIGMLFVGLLAVAGFAVVAQRRMRARVLGDRCASQLRRAHEWRAARVRVTCDSIPNAIQLVAATLSMGASVPCSRPRDPRDVCPSHGGLVPAT